jgi:hypothetical protein
MKNKMLTGLLTFENYQGRKGVGSSRIRGHWIVKNWRKIGIEIGDCEMFRSGKKYDAVIFQKVYWPVFAKAFKGLKILDLCDPDWFHWNYTFMEMVDAVDGITCSSLELAKFMAGITQKPICYIPDRVDFSVLPELKKHEGELKKVVWFGYSDNFEMVESAIPALIKRDLELIVISDETFIPRVSEKNLKLLNLPFTESTYLNDIQKGDAVINPQFTKAKWKYKSENKTIISWALGLPVAKIDKDLNAFITEIERREIAKKCYEKAKIDFDVLLSVSEMKDFMLELSQK